MSDDEIPRDLRYSAEDEWARLDEDRVFIGITSYAQEQLGDIVFLELPGIGGTLRLGEPFGVIESVKAVSDLFAPISGKVLEINEQLQDAPEIVNADCYGEGWILALEPTDPSEIDALLDANAYRVYVQERED